jgi:hypothetical protein
MSKGVKSYIESLTVRDNRHVDSHVEPNLRACQPNSARETDEKKEYLPIRQGLNEVSDFEMLLFSNRRVIIFYRKNQRYVRSRI